MDPKVAPLGSLPIGFAMALAENPAALSAFGSLSPARQKELIHSARLVNSREEMHRLVGSIPTGGTR